jgi:hypothetical protein
LPQVLPGLGVRTRYSDIAIGALQNILGYLPGDANSNAIMLVSHYDCLPQPALPMTAPV